MHRSVSRRDDRRADRRQRRSVLRNRPSLDQALEQRERMLAKFNEFARAI